LPGLRHDISILLGKHRLKGMGDDFLPGLKAPTLDSLVDRSAEKSRNPNVHFPVSPFTAGFPEALNGGCSFSSRHDAHPLLSWRFREMPDSELAVESRVKNPFTIDRFSGGKLL
jgi:hypothetical protein